MNKRRERNEKIGGGFSFKCLSKKFKASYNLTKENSVMKVRVRGTLQWKIGYATR
jgi:hypothetical protein